ncbi:MAG: HupE/UreJ family protein [Cyclobacteriaceae bacterium]|nr:HupE/UreJ family protein [Cyclobacteriaceae bacterium]
MSEFALYFGLGKDHILDANGYDHILFVIALCAVYLLHNWKKVLILVTAFTIGHSITLALATLRVIVFPGEVIEFLIPLTIFITALANVLKRDEASSQAAIQINYVFALFFGLIHGLGFSNFLRELLGQSKNIVTPLFAFNVGLELGQLIIVALFLIAGFVLVQIVGVARRDWRMVVSSAIAGIALILMKDRIFW